MFGRLVFSCEHVSTLPYTSIYNGCKSRLRPNADCTETITRTEILIFIPRLVT